MLLAALGRLFGAAFALPRPDSLSPLHDRLDAARSLVYTHTNDTSPGREISPSPAVLAHWMHISGHFPPHKSRGLPRDWYSGSMIRVLVALSPRMYRQAVALSVQRGRPGLVDVKIAPPDAMEAELESFRPHLLVHDDARGDARSGAAPIPEATLKKVPHRFEVLYSDGMDALLSADGVLTELRDASTDDLLGAVDAAAGLADREEGPG
jgi:hypothetical protein